MNKPLFDIINKEDLSEHKYSLQKQAILNSCHKDNGNCDDLFNDMDILFKIIRCKFALNENLENDNINNIAEFLNKNYYDYGLLLERIHNVLRLLFIPLYYKNNESYEPYIPQEFWTTTWGKIIISCLCVSDDFFISTSEAAEILGYKRQNINILAKNNKLPSRIIGGNYVFRLMDILNYKRKA